MRVHQIITDSRSNGPGRRYVVWTQGCSIRCPGCANQALWGFMGGTPMDIKDILKGIPPDIKAITLTGGEPLDQVNGLAETMGNGVLSLLKAAYPEYEVLVTSGYTKEQIERRCPEVLEYIDILVDGPFKRELVDKTPAWRGSINQVVHLLTNRAKERYSEYKETVAAEEKGKLEADLERARQELTVVDGEKSALLVKLTFPVRSRYERVSEGKGGMAVTAVRNRACGTCRTNLPPQTLNEIRKGLQVITCETCGRLLVWTEDSAQ